MENEKSIEKTSFNLPSDLLLRLRRACLEKGNMPLVAAVIEALEMWLEGGIGVREPKIVTPPSTAGTVFGSHTAEIKETTGNERYLRKNLSAKDIIPKRDIAHEKLERLFDSGIADVTEAIDRNLTVFCLVPGVPGETDRDAAKSAGEKAGGEQHHDRVAETLRRSAGARKRKGGTVKGIRRNRRTDRGDGKKTA